LAQLTLSLLCHRRRLIFAIGWVMKRLKLAGPRGSRRYRGHRRTERGTPRTHLLVRVGDAQVLVGVGAGGRGLTPLASPIAVKGPAPAPPFAERLRDFMKRPAVAVSERGSHHCRRGRDRGRGGGPVAAELGARRAGVAAGGGHQDGGRRRADLLADLPNIDPDDGADVAAGDLLAMTAFTRIIIVLSILRQALGMATTPSNQVLTGWRCS
jgi:flagellar biogenesis protein FliO